jgi:hypothetical protein
MASAPASRPKCRGETKAGNPCQGVAAAGSAYCGVHGGSRKPIGRKIKLNHDTVERICKAVKKGTTWEVAARAAGVHERTLLEWRNRGEEEDAQGRDTIYAHLHRETMRATAMAESDLVDLIRKHAREDFRAAIFLLERRHPERWAKTSTVNVANADASKPREVAPSDDPRRQAILDLLRTATAPPAGDPTRENTA